jgi:hypothetical protein
MRGLLALDDILSVPVLVVTPVLQAHDLPPDLLEGSHGRGNGSNRSNGHEDNAACVNVCCMYWESYVNNNGRKGCHGTRDEYSTDDLNDNDDGALIARDDSADGDTDAAIDASTTVMSAVDTDGSNKACFCIPGTPLPCILGRSHENNQNLKDTFISHFDPIRYEVKTVAGMRQRTNQILSGNV